MKVCPSPPKTKQNKTEPPGGFWFCFVVLFFVLFVFSLKLVLIQPPAIHQLLFICSYLLLAPAVTSPGVLYAMILCIHLSLKFWGWLFST